MIPLLSDAIIAIDGEYGTTTEIAYALKQRKPIAGLRLQELWKGVVAVALNGSSAVEEIARELDLP